MRERARKREKERQKKREKKRERKRRKRKREKEREREREHREILSRPLNGQELWLMKVRKKAENYFPKSCA